MPFGGAHVSQCVGSCLDVLLVDGGHSYKCCYADILNFRPLARKSALLIVDDVRGKPKYNWEKGPTSAWRAAIDAGIVVQIGCKNGLAWGHYKTKL